MTTEKAYVHGYDSRESARLQDQANTLADLLHHDTVYAAGEHVIEAGCGVGAQTVIIAAANPETRFTSIDIAPPSLKAARRAVAARGLGNVELEQGDIYNLPFAHESFDHVFLCFTLEHLADPLKAMINLQRVLKPGGTITAIEGDHESTLFHPSSDKAWKTIRCLIDLQRRANGDSLIGRRLYPLFRHAGLAEVSVSPRFVYADASRPEMVEGFTRNTYIAMVQGVKEPAIRAGLIAEVEWDEGMADLCKSADQDGVFCYTFFKARGTKPLR